MELMTCKVEGCNEKYTKEIKCEFNDNIMIYGLCDEHYIQYENTDAPKFSIAQK